MERIYKISNTIYKTNSGSEYKIIEIKGHSALIQFIRTNSVKWIHTSNIPTGKVKDVYEPSYYGVGFAGEYKHNRPPYWAAALQLWRNMIKRCYSDSDPKGYKKFGTTVEARWLCFKHFMDDLPSLPNFDLWKNKQGYQLDKDLLIPNSNVYSRETCSFVPESINKAAGKRNKKLIDGEWVTTIS